MELKKAIQSGFTWLLRLNKCKFIDESKHEGQSYRLKASIPFYLGLPPSINESGIHQPSTIIEPCMVLKFKSLQGDYIVFEVKANECKAIVQGLNGCEVYYKRVLFDKLAKKK